MMDHPSRRRIHLKPLSQKPGPPLSPNRNSAPTHDAFTDELIDYFVERFAALNPAMKHEGFKEEKEWRLVAKCDDSDKMKFKPKGAMLAAYVELSLAPRDENRRATEPIDALRSITVGPSRYQEESVRVLDAMLRNKKYRLKKDDPATGVVEIKTSSIPFRSV
jgi:hypothetical protein